MLEAISTGFFSRTVQLSESDKLVGELDMHAFRERGRLELEEGTYQLSRERDYRGDFFLERNGVILARAAKPSMFKNRFEVRLPSRTVVLRRTSAFGRRFGVFDGERQIGSIYTSGFLERRSHIDLPVDIPLSQRAFLLWLVLIIWKRQNQTAGS